ncbi:MAG: DUF2584 family protein [Minisyncoccia bacterium]
MGAIWSQQGCLRVSVSQGLVKRDNLVENNEYTFKKDGHRLFMLDTPIELVSDDWQAIARIMITEFTVGHNETKGVYKVLRAYSDEEVKIVSGTLIPFDKVRGK